MMGNKLAYNPEPHNKPVHRNRNIGYNYPPPTANNLHLDLEQTHQKTIADDIEVETVMLDDSGNASHISAGKPSRYIVRYRNEEDRLAHQLEQTQTKLRMAIEQGQKLRAKTNRYESEVKMLKSHLDQTEITDSQWKKKFYDMDKKYRSLQEDFDVLVARNKNGRDFLRQQEETIAVLSDELQKEIADKNKVIHGSLPSLSMVSESGIKSKKSKRLVQQLEIDKLLLEDRVRDLTERNQRGRDYLNRLELEKRELENAVAELETDLHNARSERNNEYLLSQPLGLYLSEENMPSNMGDRYQQLYENQWAEAFTELSMGHGTKDQQAIQILLDILTISFQHCQNLAASQLEDVEKTLRDFNATSESLVGKEFITYLKAQRMMNYAFNIESIQKTIDSKLHTLLPATEPRSATKAYITAVIDLCWLLNVQDPPCTISWDLQKGDPFQTDKYRVYTHSGKQVDYIVWPVLYSHQGGGVLCKGVAQAVYEQYVENEDETIIITTVMPPNENESPSITNSSVMNAGQMEFKLETADQNNKHDAQVVIDDSNTRKDIILASHTSDTTFPDPLRLENMEIKLKVNKQPATRNNSKEQVQYNYGPDTEHQTEVKTVSDIDALYAVVNKPKREAPNDFISNRNLTDVEYEEMEFATEEECITRF